VQWVGEVSTLQQQNFRKKSIENETDIGYRSLPLVNPKQNVTEVSVAYLPFSVV
jgi:hypothetical protein